jgi:hypothetical protein
VEDNVQPVALCQDVSLSLDSFGAASITFEDVDNSSSDNCGISSRVLSQSTFDCSNIGPNTVTMDVTDSSGSVSSCTSTVTVSDVTPPQVACNDFTVQLVSGSVNITTLQVNNGELTRDGCGIGSLSLNVSSFSCNDVGTNNVLMIATDVNGLNNSCVSQVVVEDNSLPTVVCQNIFVDLDRFGNGNTSIA